MSTIDAARISNLVNQSCQKSSKGTGTASEDIGNDYKIVAETRYSKNPLKRLFGIKRKTVSLISLKENKETTIQSFDLTKGKALNEVAENLNNLITKSTQATEGENTQASPLEKFDATCKQAESILLNTKTGNGFYTVEESSKTIVGETPKECILNFINLLKKVKTSHLDLEAAKLLEALITPNSKMDESSQGHGSPLGQSLIAIMSGGDAQADFDPEINELRGLCRDMLLDVINETDSKEPTILAEIPEASKINPAETADSNTAAIYSFQQNLKKALNIVDKRAYGVLVKAESQDKS